MDLVSGGEVECTAHLNREWRTGVPGSMKCFGTLQAAVGWREDKSETEDKVK